MTDTTPGVKSEDRGNDTLDVARASLGAGLSIIPIARDGSKAPDWKLLPQEWDEENAKYHFVWKPFTTRLPTEAEARQWFDRPRPPGIAAISGAAGRWPRRTAENAAGGSRTRQWDGARPQAFASAGRTAGSCSTSSPAMPRPSSRDAQQVRGLRPTQSRRRFQGCRSDPGP